LLQNKKEEEYDNKTECGLTLLRTERLFNHFDSFGEITTNYIEDLEKEQEWDSFVNHEKFINKCIKENNHGLHIEKERA